MVEPDLDGFPKFIYSECWKSLNKDLPNSLNKGGKETVQSDLQVSVTVTNVGCLSVELISGLVLLGGPHILII